MATRLTKIARTGQLIGGAAALALLGTACGTASGQVVTGTAPVGTVTGKFIRVGGPLGPGGTTPTVPLRGQIKFTGAHHLTFKVHVGKKGTFKILLPTGTYSVVGRTPDIKGEDGNGHVKDAKCALPHKIKVTKGHIDKIKVICAVP
ncbi:MAG TPA: hypothetical protein VFI65_06265 [Streptosporangiaceae bacterium]|nr:hypothetical protein [Streptosporangiaceae bacterium]